VKHSLNIVDKLSVEYTRKVRRCLTVGELRNLRREYMGRIASVLRRMNKDLRLLAEAKAKLRGLPDVNVDAPTIVIAAAPNVGKSTLVKRVSSAKPEIAPYPFTTRGLILGHIRLDEARVVQIMDTPGLLDRPLSEKNEIEMQAVIALRHLADVMIFMVDPTSHCGYPLEYQLHILKDIRSEFKGIPLLLAINKVDIATEDEISRARRELYAIADMNNVYEISAAKGDNVQELMDRAISLALTKKLVN